MTLSTVQFCPAHCYVLEPNTFLTTLFCVLPLTF